MNIPDDIETIDHFEKDKFVILTNPEILYVADKYIKVRETGGNAVSVAKSQVRCGLYGELYVADWIYGKDFE